MLNSDQKGTIVEKAKLVICSFCGANNKQVKMVTAGPKTNICARCAGACKELLRTGIRSAQIQRVGCTFCQEVPVEPNRIVKTVGPVSICQECVFKAKKLCGSRDKKKT